MRVRARNIAQQIMGDFPSYSFVSDEDFYFDAANESIYYDEAALHTSRGIISLLHEIAHAELAHFDYRTDLELFAMESQAWMKTRDMAERYKVQCSDNFIQNCLASYGKWVESRSTCPTCSNFSLQENKSTYRCFSCMTRWHISEGTEASIRRVKLDD